MEESRNAKEISNILKKINYIDPIGYPTILFIYKMGKRYVYKVYQGDRESFEMKKFVNDCRSSSFIR